MIGDDESGISTQRRRDTEGKRKDSYFLCSSVSLCRMSFSSRRIKGNVGLNLGHAAVEQQRRQRRGQPVRVVERLDFPAAVVPAVGARVA